jgi:hypothetical protein
MATAIHVSCDRCRAPIEAGRLKLMLLCDTPPPGIGSPAADGRPVVDLCEACARDLAAWIQAGPAGGRP